MMFNKSARLLSIVLMILITMLVVTGCGKSGNRFTNVAPTIAITSFEGWDNSYVAADYDTTLIYAFQQRIYWQAYDPDGVIAGYAFRILDEAGNPVASPGYHHIDNTGELTPDNLLALGKGWVIHYLPNADQTVSLDDPAARRTIWTSQKYAVINFPSADEQGNPIVSFSKFEVVAIDNRGAITSEAAWRNFKTTSPRPTCTISTTKGNPDGKVVGAGLKLRFTMKDSDLYIEEVPYKFEFKMMKTDLTAQTNIIPGTETGWISTEGQEKMNEFLLNRTSEPNLQYDTDANGVAFQQTRIISRATDMAGVVSVPDSHTVVNFKVKPGFHPETLIYPTKTYALGDYHYEDWGDDSTPEVIPTVIIQGKQRYATPFFKDSDGNFTAVHSQNMKVWIRWGWWGEYGNTAGNSTIYNGNPYDKKVDIVLDRSTHENYFSEITNFDLRFDGQPYNFPPFADFITTDPNGDRWLRIPLYSPLGQTIVLTGGQLPVPEGTLPGEHTFQVRCVDLQGEVDPMPAELKFYLHNYKAPADRSGILVIDDDVNHNTYSPENLVNEKYTAMLSDYTGTKKFIKRTSENNPGTTFADARKRNLAFSELQNYKLVIYHNDNPSTQGNLEYDTDALALYMISGGNVVFSHTHWLAQVLESVAKSGMRTSMLRYMGMPDIPKLSFLSTSLASNAFFQKAVGVLGYSDVNLQFGDPASFNSIVQSRHGLSTVSYFPTSTGETIFKLGCKPTTYAQFPPSAAQYELYNNKTVGTRKVNSNNSKVYTFGFPLSYMLEADTKTLMNTIISEVM
ncbi:MAG: hypothetical protein RBS43_06005 [Candidatus Cloacimonas sp.]|jgi:hypothetical protein|nr:hypothetical protein [Candidatus Cloacimonas sp.]